MPSNYISTLGSAFKKKIQRSVIGKEGDLKASLGVFIGREKLGTLVKPGPLVAAQSNLHLVDKKRNITVVEVFSRSFSIPSVSGPSFQICGYHSDRLISQPRNSLCGIEFQKTPMGTVIGDRSLNSLTSKIGNIKVAPNNAAVLRSRSRVSFDCCGKANMSLAIKEQNNNLFLYRYFIYNVTNRRGGSLPHTDLGLKCYHSSSPATSSAGTASDVPFENSGSEEQLSNATVSTERKDIAERTLKLVSGSCYLPHPDKEETGGEDAHFICTDEQAIGVADGVGGWADLGINAGLFARELMSNSVAAIHEEPKGSIDPARVLEKAHSSTKSRGSSTACIVALTKQGINAINLGDSGFIVVRDGVTVFRSPVQQHDFNFTYQLESGNGGDLPSSGQVFTVPVAPGDVIIAGTDGLFDNLYNNEVTGVVVHAKRAGLGPQVTAQKIAALARQRALDKNRQTPFSTAAQDAGIRYYGGKLDDITVVVSYVTSSSNESQPSSTSAPG